MNKTQIISLINRAPALSIEDLQRIITETGVDAIVVNDDQVLDSDVDLLYDVMKEGKSIIVFLKMRRGEGTETDPDGHFIGLNPMPKDGIELYDPAGDNPDTYLNDFGEWIPDLIERFSHFTWFTTRTQPFNTNSCGPWALIRAEFVKSEKDYSEKKFADFLGKNKRKGGAMNNLLNRKDTIDAFGPIGRDKPHMSAARAQRYGKLLENHSNLNEHAAKHVAHVVNRAVTNGSIGQKKVSDVLSGLKKALPELQLSEVLKKQFGPVNAAVFNEQAKKAAPKGGGVASGFAHMFGDLKEKHRGGVACPGAVRGGAQLAGRKRVAKLRDPPKRRAGAGCQPSKAGALLAGRKRAAAKRKAGAMLAGRKRKAGALLAGRKAGLAGRKGGAMLAGRKGGAMLGGRKAGLAGRKAGAVMAGRKPASKGGCCCCQEARYEDRYDEDEDRYDEDENDYGSDSDEGRYDDDAWYDEPEDEELSMLDLMRPQE